METLTPLILSADDLLGGAGRAALRLHEALQAASIPSRMLVRRRGSTVRGVEGPTGTLEAILWATAPRVEAHCLGRRAPEGRFHAGFLPWMRPLRGRLTGVDMVNLHWVADGFLHLNSLLSLKKPVVWTLHDYWPFTGGCHYPAGCERWMEGCGACPILGGRPKDDHSRSGFETRRRLVDHAPPSIVSPSRFLLAEARKSPLFAELPGAVIPNPLDVRRFQPLDRRFARQALGLDPDGLFVLFAAKGGASDPRKGFGLALAALSRVASRRPDARIALLVMGQSEPVSPPVSPVPLHWLGRLTDEPALNLAYNAADAFLLASSEDNLPNTVAESTAAGTPVAATSVGGTPEMLDAACGALAVPGDADSLALAVERVLCLDLPAADRDAARATGRSAARTKALSLYDPTRIAAAYREVFFDALDRAGQC